MENIIILEQVYTMAISIKNLNRSFMKVYALLLFVFFIFCGSDKIYKKQLNNGEIAIDWYYYSYITSGSPNYIVVRKKQKEEIIFEYGYGLQDIELDEDTITILHLEFYEPPKIKKDNVFGYVIKYK